MISNILLEFSRYEQVNLIAKTIYKNYKSIIDFACCNIRSLRVDLGRIENHKQKSENIKQSCFIINDDCKSVLPICYNGLIKLQGIKKDLASMMLSEIYSILNLILDNHVK